MTTQPGTITRFVSVLAASLLPFITVHAQPATTFPDKPIRLVVPYGPGGSPDVLARLLGQNLAIALKQPVVIDNKPGANGIIAAQLVAKAPNDGYTLLVADTGHLAVNPALYANLPYDPERDFTPVSLATWTPFFLVVNTSKISATTLQQLLALAKAEPGKLTYGSSGNGSPHHVTTEVFKSEAGVNIQHIPFKGVAESVPALLGGQIDMMFVALPSVAANIQSGKLRALAVSSEQRSSLMPSVPTVAESGLPGFALVSNIGVLAPAGTSRERIALLNAAIVQSLKSPELAQKFPSLGMELVGSTPADYAAMIKADKPRFQRIVQKIGMKID